MAEALFGMVSHDAKTTYPKYWLSPSSIAYIKFLKSKSNAMAPGSLLFYQVKRSTLTILIIIIL